MYIFPNKAEVTQISLTGARLIVLLGALISGPRDLTEMNNLLTECGLVDKNYSSDTIRIALSTLKALGCEMSRPCKSNGFKYKLLTYPFSLKIEDGEILSLKTIYSNLTKDASYRKALAFHKLFNTLSKHITDEKVVEKLYDITGFKKYKKEIFETVLDQLGKHNSIELIYLSPTNKSKVHTIIFGDLFLKNNKLYIQGTDVEMNKPITLNLLRVEKINSVTETKQPFVSEACNVTYVLRNKEYHKLPDGHSIKDLKKDSVTIEAEFTNPFFAVQYLLSLGADCTVIEPLEIRNEIIDKLTELRKVYE